MTIVLACPWQPRGELERFKRYYERLTGIYDHIVLAVSYPEDDILTDLDGFGIPYTFYEMWSGRHKVMDMALKTPAEYIHYVDMDRLIRWVETRPEELETVANRIQTIDCLVTGRTKAAYETHSRTLLDTERLPNTFFSHWFGRDMDFLSGSRGFHRNCMEFIRQFPTEHNALEMDVAWLVLLHRAGFTWDYIEVDGLDWETADRHRSYAANRDQQRELAEQQDQDAHLWALRVRVAQEVTDLGLKAIDMELEFKR